MYLKHPFYSIAFVQFIKSQELQNMYSHFYYFRFYFWLDVNRLKQLDIHIKHFDKILTKYVRNYIEIESPMCISLPEERRTLFPWVCQPANSMKVYNMLMNEADEITPKLLERVDEFIQSHEFKECRRLTDLLRYFNKINLYHKNVIQKVLFKKYTNKISEPFVLKSYTDNYSYFTGNIYNEFRFSRIKQTVSEVIKSIMCYQSIYLFPYIYIINTFKCEFYWFHKLINAL